ncbi:MAG: metallophosphoesterase [Nanohaloarchaea archaeon]|nr:metallophosphoesterase [Candidatus Nanohaloarchaea archaeon]
MKIGVISDTHDNIELAKKAVEYFESEKVDKVVHCGDMVAPFAAELFDKDFDFIAVRGNNDGEWNLKQTVEEFGEFHNNIAELELSGNEIAVYHGTEESIVESLVESGSYEYVLRGHTHQKKVSECNGAIELNPGGIKLPGQDEEFHVAIIDFEKGDINFRRIKE